MKGISPWNWSSLQLRWGKGKGVVEMDAIPVVADNANVVTRGMFKLAAHGDEPRTFAVLDIDEAKVVRDRLSAWIAAKENQEGKS